MHTAYNIGVGFLRCLSLIEGQCEGLVRGISDKYSSHAFFIICTVMNKTYNLSDVGGLRRTENIYRYESKEFIGGYDGCGFEF